MISVTISSFGIKRRTPARTAPNLPRSAIPQSNDDGNSHPSPWSRLQILPPVPETVEDGLPLTSDSIPAETGHVSASRLTQHATQFSIGEQACQMSHHFLVGGCEQAGLSVDYGLRLVIPARDYRQAARCSLPDYPGRAFPARWKEENVCPAIFFAKLWPPQRASHLHVP